MDDARVHANQYRIYMLSIMNSLARLTQQYDMDLGQIFGVEDYSLQLMPDGQERDEFTSWLISAACRMNKAMNWQRDNTTRNVISKAKRYIQENYRNPDLSVEMICRELHLSQAYFSTMFKKETGQTYIAYLTEIRLNRAVELLNETNDKTYVIAQKVGYQEQNYFSYVFKKRFGVSPTKFRGA